MGLGRRAGRGPEASVATSTSSAASTLALRTCITSSRSLHAEVTAEGRDRMRSSVSRRISARGDPVLGQREPEGQPGELAVAAEGALDPLVGDPGPARHPPVLRPGPRVEDQPPVAPEQHHHVRHRVRAHPGQRQQRLGHLLVGQRRIAQRLEVDPALGRVGRQCPQVRAAISRAGHVAVERLIGRRHLGRGREGVTLGYANRGCAEMIDERGDHPHRARPGAVGGADRLDHVLEHGRASQHPPGARGGPGEHGVGRGHGVEPAQVLVEREHPPDLFLDPRGWSTRWCTIWSTRWCTEDGDAGKPRIRRLHHDHPGTPVGRQHRLQPRAVLGDPVGRQVGDAVGEQGPREVDRLAAGTAQLDQPAGTRRRAASSVFCIRQAIVIGPTPPGTGVIALATSLTASKSTSPCSPSSRPVHAHVDHGRSRLDPVGLDHPVAADRGDQDVGAPAHPGKVARARVAHGHGGVGAEQELGHRLAEQVRAPDHDRLRALEGHALEQHHHPGRRARPQTGESERQPPGVGHGEPVHVLVGIDPVGDHGAVQVVGHRELAEDPADRVVGVQGVDQLQRLGLRHRRRQRMVKALDPKLAGGAPLRGDVDLRGGIVADQDGGETRRDAVLGRELGDLAGHLLAQRGRHRLAVDDPRGHQPSGIGSCSNCVIRRRSSTRVRISSAPVRCTRSVPNSSTLYEARAVP